MIGLISTFGILNREKDLHIYGPEGIKEVTLLQLKVSKSYSKFNIIFHELTSKESEVVFEDDKVSVTTIPLNHRVYTNGFLFKEKTGLRKIDINKVKMYPEIETCDYHNLKAGKDYTLENGTILKNEELTLDPKTTKSFAFCSDTSYKEDIIPLISESDLLYHEATFLSDREDLAKKTKHSTAKQAAIIAKKSKVKQLVIGHYSSRYNDINLFKEEAEQEFENIILAEEGKVISID